ncbi:MAG: transcription-repair coupling factor [Gaiellaceae bacterium]
MDRPVLHAFVRELVASERLRTFAEALPTRARVSEPALPLLLAALHEHLARPLVCLLAEDADARDAADAAAWFLGEGRVALLPSRGVHWGSGLEAPPHLVGERARALDVLATGGLVCASAAALAEGLPPAGARPGPLRLKPGDEPGLEELVEHLALAGYSRVEQVAERGQLAVRGGIVDVFPTTGREPLRIELYGDEVEGIRAFSPFTQRALHPVEQIVVYPAAERRLDLVEPWLEDEPRPEPPDLVPPLADGPDLVWQADEVRQVWTEEFGRELPLRAVTELDPLPQGQPFAFEAQRPALTARGLAEAENELAAYVHGGNRVVVAFPHPGEALRTRNLLRKVAAGDLAPGDGLPREAGVHFAVAPARRGFVWRELGLVLLPDTQVFRKRPPRADARLGRALQSFSDLRTGDHVVHEDHGIGSLLGFETKAVAGVTRDYLFLGFRGDDRLYVPHEQIGKVSRYIGADARTPALSKLGGKAWDNLKTRARSAVRELATELIALYAQRQQAPGFAHDLTSDWLERLEAGFPYRETEDQARAIEEVKEDLEAPRPMDRLVCGDVGFGKTEVGVRAAFAAALNGKQVLMLVPTTILAEQHWHTFRDRYRDFPVRVEMVSRFRRPSDVKQVLRDFAEGKVEVLIGTHRVLSRDVIPRELGLVIVDEEQRFGVAQKELLRALRLEVDVLALTATPIPRTLHMSLSGLRDISVIETPPQGRRPIRTHVGEFDEELVKTALEREHARGGQSFYLHNRVDSIDEAARKLQLSCPGLRFLVAHGQMRERELEERMLAFLRGDADVLVSTTIIESGLDIPQANTLIVERADAFGLAQLYQIRGRVGRSDVLAHAYLFYPAASELSPEARARLATLADHTELGAGFAIAMRDLEIRGAGDLLGAEQSGHVAALGFELYVEMLGEAVAELQGQRRPVARPVRVEAQVDAYVPAAYVPSEAQKIDLHRRLALAESEDELRELRAGLEDRYGPMPEPVGNLFAIQEAKLKLAALGADYLVFRGGRASVGPLVLGSGELRELRGLVDTAVYASSRQELSLRDAGRLSDDGGFTGALRLVDAILDARRAA